MGLHHDSKKDLSFISKPSLAARGSAYCLRGFGLYFVCLPFVSSFSLACLAQGCKQLATKPETGTSRRHFIKNPPEILYGSGKERVLANFVKHDPPEVCRVTTEHTGSHPQLTPSILSLTASQKRQTAPLLVHKVKVKALRRV